MLYVGIKNNLFLDNEFINPVSISMKDMTNFEYLYPIQDYNKNANAYVDGLVSLVIT